MVGWLAENLRRVHEKIEKAQSRSKRSSQTVTLVAVSKLKTVDMIREAQALGQQDFGENYVQELTEKIDLIPSVKWHFIGSLQRNKCKFIVGRVQLIHSVDRLELAQELSRLAELRGVTQNILIQVKISDEESKSGVELAQAKSLLKSILNLKGLSVQGFMTFPPLYDDPEKSRPDFKTLSVFRDECEREFSLESLRELSMGSSHDYEVAIEEGATIVRIGTEIFGERK